MSTDAIPAAVASRVPGQRSRGIARTLKYVLLIIFALVVLLPAYVLFVTSFKGLGDATPANAWKLPQVWETAGWSRAWEQLGPALGRTFAMVIPASIISSVLGSMNGFVLSKWRFPGADIVFTLILFGMFIPYQAVMVPLVQLMGNLGVPSGVPSLIVLHVVYGLPITTLIFRNYYAGVPVELVEAARVDGAGMLRTYASIILPISAPAFVVVLMWQFTSAWNDYLFALFFSTSRNGPVTIALNFLASGQLQDYSASMAGALIASVPTLIIYILLGRYFVGGLMAGSVKG
ncbi:glucose/mannose transport system permease protein [Nocardioides luteus]|uniref:ABC transporter permease n=1 Tax=Nocardioides luteus TaxID=1844 RepID=A0ABQ5ST33_9ACTN|nr:carbohydrate ABC transporter permease [Nocardioides luteus]MDR7311221.1 glucose/mannose transport system permease protein [Nocardioides luteus]GGR63125.1 ABC transporter permease [Nocardioides luteus]GLJ66768.1 ABC transporter permease [Nocardioides luteus]